MGRAKKSLNEDNCIAQKDKKGYKQLCWTCKKSCGFCLWSSNFILPKGAILDKGGFIITCPEYVSEPPKQKTSIKVVLPQMTKAENETRKIISEAEIEKAIEAYRQRKGEKSPEKRKRAYIEKCLIDFGGNKLKNYEILRKYIAAGHSLNKKIIAAYLGKKSYIGTGEKHYIKTANDLGEAIEIDDITYYPTHSVTVPKMFESIKTLCFNSSDIAAYFCVGIRQFLKKPPYYFNLLAKEFQVNFKYKYKFYKGANV